MRSIFPINHICVKRINLSTSECVSVALLWEGVCVGHTTRHLTIVVLFLLLFTQTKSYRGQFLISSASVPSIMWGNFSYLT